jgi:hypothetical protein
MPPPTYYNSRDDEAVESKPMSCRRENAMINRRALAIRRRKGIRQCHRWNIGAQFLTPRFIGRAGVTPVPCSCFMCGNPRRKVKGKERLTMQERKALLDTGEE